MNASSVDNDTALLLDPISRGKWPSSAILALVALVVLATVLVAANVLEWSPLGGPYSADTVGTVADWVAATGTIAALAAGVVALVHTRAELDLNRKSVDAQRRLSEAQHASQISAWLDWYLLSSNTANPAVEAAKQRSIEVWNESREGIRQALRSRHISEAMSNETIANGDLAALDAETQAAVLPAWNRWIEDRDRIGEAPPETGRWMLALSVLNNSAQPAYAGRITLSIGRAEQSGKGQCLLTQEISLPVIRPAPESKISPILINGFPMLSHEVEPSPAILMASTVEMTFRDSRGLSWTRDQDGMLHRLDASESISGAAS